MDLGIKGRRAIVCASSKGLGRACAIALANEGVHVTLTGVRGGLAPPAGVLVYMGLEAWRRGAGEFALLLPLAMTAAGALGFNRMQLTLARSENVA